MRHDAPPSNDKPGRRGLRAWHWLSICLGLLVLSLVAGALWMSRRNEVASSLVALRLSELRAKGLPTDDASLAVYYESLTTRANVDRWIRLLGRINSEEFRSATVSIYPWKDEPAASVDAQQAWPDEQAALAFLHQWADLLRQAHQLAALDQRARLPIKFDGLHTNMEPMSQMRQLARLFQLEAFVSLRGNNSAEATDAILSIFGVARMLEGQPIVVGQLVSLAIEGIAFGLIKEGVEHNRLSERDLKRILARLHARTAWSWRWQVALNGERAATLPVFHDSARYLPAEQHRLLPWRSHDLLAYLQATDQAIELPTDDMTTFAQAAGRLEQQLSAQLQSDNLLLRFDRVLSELVMPGFRTMADAFIQSETLARLAIVGIGARIYHRQRGRWPESLDDLAEVGLKPNQLQPIGGKPFGYRQLDGQVTLWGFRVQSHSSTPPEPPNPESAPGWNEVWVWYLK